MNAEQIVRRIDEQGYAVIHQGARPDLVARYLESIQGVKRPNGWPHKAEVLHLDPVAFTWVLRQKRLRKVIRRLCGDYARLDNHFLFTYPGEGAKPNVHGGPFSERGSVYYQSQGLTTQTSNLKIGIALQAQCGPGIIPGTHKLNDSYRVVKVIRGVHELTTSQLAAGEIVIFTDALLHGTPDVSGFRQMLYYTFTPGHVCWAQYRHQPKDVLDKLSSDVRGYFRPPGLVHWEPDDRGNLQWARPTIGDV